MEPKNASARRSIASKGVVIIKKATAPFPRFRSGVVRLLLRFLNLAFPNHTLTDSCSLDRLRQLEVEVAKSSVLRVSGSISAEQPLAKRVTVLILPHTDFEASEFIQTISNDFHELIQITSSQLAACFKQNNSTSLLRLLGIEGGEGKATVVFLDLRFALRLRLEDIRMMHLYLSTNPSVGAITGHPSIKNVQLQEPWEHSPDTYFARSRKVLDLRVWGVAKETILDQAQIDLDSSLPEPAQNLSLLLGKRNSVIHSLPLHGVFGTWETLRPCQNLDLLSDRGSDSELMYLALSRADASVSFPYPIGAKLKSLDVSGPQTVLYIQPISGGGLALTHEALVANLPSEIRPLRVSHDGEVFSLIEVSTRSTIFSCRLEKKVEPFSHRSPDYDLALAMALYAFEVKLVHVEHLAWQSLGIKDICAYLEVPYVYSCHDYYALCSSHNLLDENLNYCAGKCTSGSGACQTALWPKWQMTDLKNGTVSLWRMQMTHFLEGASGIYAPSNSVQNIYCRLIPSIESKFHVKPHSGLGVIGKYFPTQPKETEPVRLLVLGDIGPHKGEFILRGLKDSAAASGIEIHQLGPERFMLASLGVQHGEYEISNLSEKISEIQPHASLILSITPETYSHTLTESWSNGLPVVSLELEGAVSERIAETGCGVLLDRGMSAEGITESIASFVRSESFLEIRNRVQQWQKSVLPDAGIKLAGDYVDSYAQILIGSAH